MKIPKIKIRNRLKRLMKDKTIKEISEGNSIKFMFFVLIMIIIYMGLSLIESRGIRLILLFIYGFSFGFFNKKILGLIMK